MIANGTAKWRAIQRSWVSTSSPHNTTTNYHWAINHYPVSNHQGCNYWGPNYNWISYWTFNYHHAFNDNPTLWASYYCCLANFHWVSNHHTVSNYHKTSNKYRGTNKYKYVKHDVHQCKSLSWDCTILQHVLHTAIRNIALQGSHEDPCVPCNDNHCIYIAEHKN